MLYQRVTMSDWQEHLEEYFSREALEFLEVHYEELGEEDDLEWDPLTIESEWVEYTIEQLKALNNLPPEADFDEAVGNMIEKLMKTNIVIELDKSILIKSLYITTARSA